MKVNIYIHNVPGVGGRGAGARSILIGKKFLIFRSRVRIFIEKNLSPDKVRVARSIVPGQFFLFFDVEFYYV